MGKKSSKVDSFFFSLFSFQSFFLFLRMIFIFVFDWRAAACGTLDGARSRYIQFFFLIFHSKFFFFSYIFREKINVVSGPGAGGKGTEKKKNNRIFFFMSCFFSLSLSHLR